MLLGMLWINLPGKGRNPASMFPSHGTSIKATLSVKKKLASWSSPVCLDAGFFLQ